MTAQSAAETSAGSQRMDTISALPSFSAITFAARMLFPVPVK
jgi:hypothetical protein